MQNNTRAVANYDYEERGVMDLPEEGSLSAYPSILDQFAMTNQFVKQSGLPISLAMLETRKDLDRAGKLRMLTSYTSSKPKTIGDFIGHQAVVIGAIIHWHGPYQGRDGESKPGYHHMLLKLDEYTEVDVMVGRKVRTVKTHTLITTSANQPCELFLGMLQIERWYDWEVGLKVAFTGNPSDGYFVTVVSDDDEEEEELPAAASTETGKRAGK
jgi:hypothetical protein